MSLPKIAIIVGSTRETRFADKPAQWIYELAAQRDDLQAEIVDLRDYPLPFFNEVASNAWAPSQDPEAVRWQKKLEQFDGYIFIAAEYNHSITGVLKNALDQAYTQWVRKAAGFVGYGGVGGARAVEHLRQITAELQMAPTRAGVYIQWGDMTAAREGKNLAEIPYLQPTAQALLDDVVWWANALRAARSRA